MNSAKKVAGYNVPPPCFQPNMILFSKYMILEGPIGSKGLILGIIYILLPPMSHQMNPERQKHLTAVPLNDFFFQICFAQTFL